MTPTPRDSSTGWLVGEVASFDHVVDFADLVVARLAARVRAGDSNATATIGKVRELVRGLDGLNRYAVAQALTALEAINSEAAP